MASEGDLDGKSVNGRKVKGDDLFMILWIKL